MRRAYTPTLLRRTDEAQLSRPRTTGPKKRPQTDSNGIASVTAPCITDVAVEMVLNRNERLKASVTCRGLQDFVAEQLEALSYSTTPQTQNENNKETNDLSTVPPTVCTPALQTCLSSPDNYSRLRTSRHRPTLRPRTSPSGSTCFIQGAVRTSASSAAKSALFRQLHKPSRTIYCSATSTPGGLQVAPHSLHCCAQIVEKCYRLSMNEEPGGTTLMEAKTFNAIADKITHFPAAEMRALKELSQMAVSYGNVGFFFKCLNQIRLVGGDEAVLEPLNKLLPEAI